VARLAGVPERIIERAHRYLQELEAGHHSPAAQADLFTAPPSALPAPDPLRERLADIDPRHAPPTRSSTNCCNT
jgi:DNA mismatch repair ATPase MutS